MLFLMPTRDDSYFSREMQNYFFRLDESKNKTWYWGDTWHNVEIIVKRSISINLNELYLYSHKHKLICVNE